MHTYIHTQSLSLSLTYSQTHKMRSGQINRHIIHTYLHTHRLFRCEVGSNQFHMHTYKHAHTHTHTHTHTNTDLSDEERERINFDHPDSLETDLMVEHLKQLLKGNAVE